MPRNHRWPLALVLCALMSCQSTGPTPAKLPAKTRLAASPAVVTNAVKARGTLLKKPGTASVTVSGLITMDAGYLIGQDGASIVANDGATIVANDGATIVANDGATIVANDGATIVANDGATIVGQDGTSLIGQDGTSLVHRGGAIVVAAKGALIGQDGTSLIGQDGTSLVASSAGNVVASNPAAVLRADGVTALPAELIGQDGTSLIGEAAGGYRLFQAAPQATGVQLPAAAMLVRAIDPATNLALPLGVDDQGRPVYVANTDTFGRFELYLPAGVTHNVRLVASPLGSTNPRTLHSYVIAPQHAKDLVLKEDYALATSVLRSLMVGEIETLLRSQDGGTEPFKARFKGVTAAAFDTIADKLNTLHTEVQARGGFDALPIASRLAVAAAGADALLASLDLQANSTTLGAIQAAFVDLDRGTGSVLQSQGPGAFAQQAWLLDANAQQDLLKLPRFEIVKATDVSEVLIKAYFSRTDDPDQDRKIQPALADIIAMLPGPSGKLGELPSVGKGGAVIHKAVPTLWLALAQTWITDPDTAQHVHDSILAKLDSVKATPPPAATAVGGPPLAIPTAGPAGVTASLLMGFGLGANLHDVTGLDYPEVGPFSYPGALVADGLGHLYVADYAAIRRIDLDDPTHAVHTVVGYPSTLGDDDGPAELGNPDHGARFQHIVHMFSLGADKLVLVSTTEALETSGTLAVSGATVREVDFAADGKATVTTLAGDPHRQGHADGPGLEATFFDPHGATLDAHGDLILSDPKEGRICRVSLHDPDHRVTTLYHSTVPEQRPADPNDLDFTQLAGPAYIAADPETPDAYWLRDAFSRIVRLELGGDGPAVRTVVGTNAPSHKNGFWANAGLDSTAVIASQARQTLLVGSPIERKIYRLDLTADRHAGTLSPLDLPADFTPAPTDPSVITTMGPFTVDPRDGAVYVVVYPPNTGNTAIGKASIKKLVLTPP